MARMQAAVVERPGEGLRMMEVARPEPGPGEVLIRVAACGVCHSDLHSAQIMFCLDDDGE